MDTAEVFFCIDRETFGFSLLWQVKDNGQTIQPYCIWQSNEYSFVICLYCQFCFYREPFLMLAEMVLFLFQESSVNQAGLKFTLQLRCLQLLILQPQFSSICLNYMYQALCWAKREIIENPIVMQSFWKLIRFKYYHQYGSPMIEYHWLQKKRERDQRNTQIQIHIPCLSLRADVLPHNSVIRKTVITHCFFTLKKPK